MFPITTLDSDIVKAKGFHIPGFDAKSEQSVCTAPISSSRYKHLL
ncbi:hypothetical protein [Anoxybacteroides tepidamans]